MAAASAAAVAPTASASVSWQQIRPQKFVIHMKTQCTVLSSQSHSSGQVDITKVPCPWFTPHGCKPRSTTLGCGEARGWLWLPLLALKCHITSDLGRRHCSWAVSAHDREALQSGRLSILRRLSSPRSIPLWLLLNRPLASCAFNWCPALQSEERQSILGLY